MIGGAGSALPCPQGLCFDREGFPVSAGGTRQSECAGCAKPVPRGPTCSGPTAAPTQGDDGRGVSHASYLAFLAATGLAAPVLRNVGWLMLCTQLMWRHRITRGATMKAPVARLHMDEWYCRTKCTSRVHGQSTVDTLRRETSCLQLTAKAGAMRHSGCMCADANRRAHGRIRVRHACRGSVQVAGGFVHDHPARVHVLLRRRTRAAHRFAADLVPCQAKLSPHKTPCGIWCLHYFRLWKSTLLLDMLRREHRRFNVRGRKVVSSTDRGIARIKVATLCFGQTL